MNRILGIASVGLASLALGVALWGPGKSEAPDTQDAPRVQDSTADVRALQTRVKALEETVQLLSQRLMAFEQRGGTASAGTGGPPPAGLEAEVAKLREELRGVMVGEAMTTDSGRQTLKELMRTVQEEQRTEQRQQWQQQVDQMRTQAEAERSERLKTFITNARLNYSQEQALTKAMQAEDAKRQELAASMAGGRPGRDMRQQMRDLRTQTDTEMQKVLSAEQLTQYQEMRREDLGGRGGGLRGGPMGAGAGWEARGTPGQ
ncbi:hypothetical protein D7W79_19800 [Corallococcus exercitus]|uniref:hypothetical protein n=1 Tax=Corallococcus exercitus TaxID=2316736 RepID=UPI000E9FFDCA|nr:hypothetical protein [Corallococcus exercitus]RKG75691.1 hypothetical protein D7W79_19800 [Corallococcus exercitus]